MSLDATKRRHPVTVVAATLAAFGGLLYLVHYLGVRSFSQARVGLRPPGALPQSATTGGTVWDGRMRDFVDRLGRLQAAFEEESCAPLGWGRDAAGLRDVLPRAASLVGPFDADLNWFASTFAPTDDVLDELARGESLLKGWYSPRSFPKAWNGALGAALVLRRGGRSDRARDLILAAWVAGSVLTRGMQGDSLLFEAMMGLSCMDAAHHEAAWFLVEEPPSPVVDGLAAATGRLRRGWPDHAWAMRGELSMVRRVDADMRRSQGFLGYHALTPFYGLAASQYEPYYVGILALLERPSHKAVAPLQVHAAALLSRRLHPLTASVIPAMGRAYGKHLAARALLDVLPLLPRIRRDPGASPDLPADPFTGGTLSVQVVGDGFTLTAGPAPGTRDEAAILLQVPRP